MTEADLQNHSESPVTSWEDIDQDGVKRYFIQIEYKGKQTLIGIYDIIEETKMVSITREGETTYYSFPVETEVKLPTTSSPQLPKAA